MTIYQDMKLARDKNPNHTGMTRYIYQELERMGPSSIYKLVLSTGLKIVIIKHALEKLTLKGKVVCFKGPKNVWYYKIYEAPVKVESVAGDEYRIAGRITIPQYRYGGTRLG